MFLRAIYIAFLTGLLVFTFGCQSYNKTLKSGNNELKYETAIDLYEAGDFSKALQFFDILRAVYRGTEKGEMLTYYTANSYFQTKNYTVASYYYKQYAQMYPRGGKAEESSFMAAFCNYMNSPRPSLDQTSTYNALSEFQNFVDLYPNSDKIVEVNKLMDELREKLELKAYNVSKLYYKMEDYQAAITSFESLLDEYPDTDFKEDILYFITIAYYEYADKSVWTKKDERFEKTIEAYNNLIYFYPDSDYIKNVENINKDAREELKK